MDKEELTVQRDVLLNILTSELPVLRAKMGISQEDISKIVGISRQTYSLIESKKQKMTWVTFMALLELVKLKSIKIYQKNNFNDIFMERIEADEES